MSDEFVFFDRKGAAYLPAPEVDVTTGTARYLAKPKRALSTAVDALKLTSIEAFAEAVLVTGMAGRFQAANSAQTSYLRFGAGTLVRYRLDARIADRIRVSPQENLLDSDDDVLRHFDWHLGFRESRRRWMPGQTEDFIAFARMTHEMGLDWYFVEMGKYELRFGNKLPGRIDANEVLARVGDSPARMKLSRRAPTVLQVFNETRVVIDGRVLDWANEHRDVLARRARDTRSPGFWPDEYLSDVDSDLPQVDPSPQVTSPVTTNLILYGPPGTGKTFATAREAVRLCDGAAPEVREELMLRYRQLLDEGRIVFTTFHQSMAYEEFVEGLRPMTDFVEAADIDGLTSDAAAGPGFRLVPKDGIFKRISEKARLSEVPGVREHLDHARPVFKIALGERINGDTLTREGLERGLIHLGWGGEIDWSDVRFNNFTAIKKHWQDTVDPAASGKDANIETINTLRAVMQVGDYVLLSEGRDLVRAIGEITGDYFYDKTATEHPHRREVRWLWKAESPVARAPIYGRNFRRHSIYQLASEAIHWEKMDSLVFDEGESNGLGGAPHVLIIDEVNRANISKVFGELITLIEPDKRLGRPNQLKVTLPYSGESFGVPSNLHIVATMNTADRSIALIDKALRRRFSFRELMPDYSLPEMVKDVMDAGVSLADLLRTINDRIEYLADREHQVGHAWLMDCRNKDDLDVRMRERVIPLIAEYFFEDWGRVAEVLGGRKDNAFLEMKELAPPPGVIGDEVRHRWKLRDSFAADAYTRLLAKA